MNLVTLARVLRNPTVKSEITARGFDNNGESSVPVGFANYPISQAADITAFKANLVPVGDDQLPMLEQTREIVRSFNRIYKTDVLVECKPVLPENKVCLRLPGTDGNSKMSKSLGNCIYLSDEPEDIKKKVNSIKTFPRNIEDPGILEGNILFIYLEAFCKDKYFELYYPEFKNLNELKVAYQKGGIGDGRIKQFLNFVMQDELRPIREKRKVWEKRIPEVINILKTGTEKANKIANETLSQVKAAMCINYFDDDTFEKEQIAKYSIQPKE
jgi:tryptophanyl-tRNA synthetase